MGRNQNVSPTRKSAWFCELKKTRLPLLNGRVGQCVQRISGESRSDDSFSVSPPPIAKPAELELSGLNVLELETWRYKSCIAKRANRAGQQFILAQQWELPVVHRYFGATGKCTSIVGPMMNGRLYEVADADALRLLENASVSGTPALAPIENLCRC